MLIKMKLGKSTKGTHVYEDKRDDAPIPSLYIKRGALPNPPPKIIPITLDFGYQDDE